MRKALPVLLLLLLLPTRGFAAPDLERLRASVVQVFVMSQGEDYAMPWRKPSPQGANGTAFCIGPNMLLTNAHVVSDAKVLRVKRADRSRWYEAKVLFAGNDCDLAILGVDEPMLWQGMQPLEVGECPVMQSKVAAVGYPVGGNKLSITEGVVSRIEVRPYTHTGADAHLAIQIDAAINPGNSGGPVMQDGKVVGVAFQGQFFAQNIGYMIPPSVIRHFLKDIEDGRYDGYPELGIYTADLQNDPLRDYLGVPEGESGVLALKATPYASCVGLVERDDVITRIDGIPIENDGMVKIDGEFFEYTHIVEGKQIGETVTLTVRRKGELREIPVKLKGWGARMSPSIAYDERPEYLVLGGYVFVPLSTNYLMATRGSDDLMYYYQQYYRTVAEEGKTPEQLVLLSQVLPDPSTRYRSYRNAIIASVDGKVPNDFREFVSLVESGKDLVKIEFEGVNVPPLVIERAKIAEAHARICRSLNIPVDRYVKEPK
jgi:S1-C subfamily serine protease